MLADRIASAIFFRKGVYAETAADESFSQTAWVLAALSCDLSALGTQAARVHASIWAWVLAAGLVSCASLLVFALSALALPWVARSMFNVSLRFDQAARALGLASIWGLAGLIGIAAVFEPFIFVAGVARLLAGVAVWLADLVVVKEITGLGWSQTTVTAGFVLLLQVFTGLALDWIVPLALRMAGV